MPEISVVMPVYNGEKYLPEAIESVLGQTFADLEFLILCEHGTNDASRAIVERYAARDERIRPVFHEERLGISASLNAGLRMARGRYIARMDGDDVSGPRRFEVQKLYLDAYPQIGACGIYPTMLYAPGMKGDYYLDYVSDPEQIASHLLFFSMMCHPSVMLRRELTESCMYDETLPGMEDRDLFVRLGQITKLTNILDPSLFFYRRTGENASRVHSDRDNLLRRELLRRALGGALDLTFDDRQMDVLNFIGGAAYKGLSPDRYGTVVQELEALLGQIQQRGEELGKYRPDCLERTLRHRWFREKRKLERLTKGAIPESAERALRKGRYASIYFS